MKIYPRSLPVLSGAIVYVTLLLSVSATGADPVANTRAIDDFQTGKLASQWCIDVAGARGSADKLMHVEPGNQAGGLFVHWTGEFTTGWLLRQDLRLKDVGGFISADFTLPSGAPASATAGLVLAAAKGAASGENVTHLEFSMSADGRVRLRLRTRDARERDFWHGDITGFAPGRRVQLRIERTGPGRYLLASGLEGSPLHRLTELDLSHAIPASGASLVPGLMVSGTRGEPGFAAQFARFEVGHADNDTLFPSFADSHTAGLWLFDDPSYLNSTLTDAGLAMFDLRLLPGGRLVPGRFGGALSLSSTAGPGARAAAQAGTFAGIPDLRPVLPAERVLQALEGRQWSCEFWLKLEDKSAGTVTLLELGTGETKQFECTLAAKNGPFFLLAGGRRYHCPTDPVRLRDGQWHHVAFTFQDDRVRHFLDGRMQSTSVSPAAAFRGDLERDPASGAGLIGVIRRLPMENGKLRLGNAINVRDCGAVDFFWGNTRDLSWSEQWRGAIGTAALAGKEQEVEFFAECADGARLVIDGKTVIDGLADPAVRTGRSRLAPGKTYPLELELRVTHRAERGRLLWRHSGRDWEIVPGSELSHSSQDKRAALEEAGKALAVRPYFTLGAGRFYEHPVDGMLDELRFSDVVRYSGKVFEPRSFSRNFGPNPPPPSKPSGPPPLFAQDPSEPLTLGARRHVFIDDMIVEARRDVHLVSHPPRVQSEDVKGVTAIPDSVYYQDGRKVTFIAANCGPPRRPDSTNWDGRAFEDMNPDTPPEERFKYAGRDLQRGIYAFVSPDGLHWRRNETCMFPIDPDGGNEMFWDDQRGTYVTFVRHSPLGNGRAPFGRAGARAETREYFKPWPFQPQSMPELFAKQHTLPAFTGELPTPFEPYAQWSADPRLFLRDGQIYRTRAVKYPWAPDTYVAFPMRLIFPADGSDQPLTTELATSRDGRNWRFFGAPDFYGSGWELEPGFRVVTAVSRDAMVRQRDELWTYAVLTDGTHHRRSKNRRIVRFVNRLDGFTSLEARAKAGWFCSRPLVFQGGRLELNVTARGSLRVALLDEAGNEIPGFRIPDCDSIRTDAIRHTVTWGGRADVSSLAGRPIRLRFEMQDANIFAFQFTAGD